MYQHISVIRYEKKILLILPGTPFIMNDQSLVSLFDI